MLRSSELADHLGLSKNTVLDLANNGKIPAIRLPGGHYRFNLNDVLEALRTGGESNDD
jgi:excisionase family DNA binding protein